MARIDVIRGHRANHLFYNVDAAVGKGCQNQRNDVLLVQYLLKENMRLKTFSYIPTTVLDGNVNVRVNGLWDEMWNVFLLNYQNDLKQRHKPVVRDGRVDPVTGGRVLGPIHHTIYTMLWLNMGYLEVRPADFPKIADAGDCPGELRLAIKVQFASPDA
jgi:hypothetical protein